MIKVKTLKSARLNGEDIDANVIVEIEPNLANAWIYAKIAEEYSEKPIEPPKEDGEKYESQINNIPDSGTSKSGRSKAGGKAK